MSVNGLGKEEEKIVSYIAKVVFDHVWVEREKPLNDLIKKPLGTETLRADVFITGLTSFPDGLAISVRTQNSEGSAIEKIPHHVEYQLLCYPCPVLLLMLGDIWHTTHGQEFYNYARNKRDGIHFLDVLNSLDDFLRWCKRIAEREKRHRSQFDLWSDFWNHGPTDLIDREESA